MLVETQGNIELLKEQIRDLTDAKADIYVAIRFSSAPDLADADLILTYFLFCSSFKS